jgi:hypothetical protein
VASTRALERLRRRRREPFAALVERAATRGRDELLASLDEGRQRRLRIGGDRERDFLEALDVLVVAAHVQVAARDAQHFRVRLRERDRASHLLVAITIEAAVERVLVEREDHVGVRHAAATR